MAEKVIKKGPLDAINSYYDHIYVISIARNLETRQKKLEKNLNGLKYTLFPGVDGKELTEDDLSQCYNDIEARRLFAAYCAKAFESTVDRSFTKSEIGCALSHLAVYKDMLENNFEKVLILEDDARIEFHLADKIAEAIHEIPENCDLLYWGYRWYDSESFLSSLKRKWLLTPLYMIFGKTGYIKNPFNERYPSKFKQLIKHAGYHCGTHAYGINREAATKLIQVNTPMIMCADQLFTYCYEKKILSCYVTTPLFFREDQSMPSSIVEKS